MKHFETRLAHFSRDDAATMVEFAVSLPLLLVLVVGIYDFGGAFNLKQELNNAVREGARYGASSSNADLSQTGVTPPTVVATAILVDSYLQTARLNDCGLNSVVTTGTAAFSSPLTWTYTASCGSYGNLTLTIQRGFSKVAGAVGSTNIQIIYTQVSIQYPYQWQFNRVIQLLVSGASYVGTSLISTSATVPNVF
jgi:Flp pilus assembly protein TadG